MNKKFEYLRLVEWGVGVVQEGLRPGKVVEDSLSAFVTVCDSSEAEVLRYDAEILMLRLGRVGPYIQMVQLMSWRHGVFFSQWNLSISCHAIFNQSENLFL